MPRSVSYSDAHDYGPDNLTFNLRQEREAIPHYYDAHEAVLRLAHLVIDNPINAYILCVRIVMPELRCADIAERIANGFPRAGTSISEASITMRLRRLSKAMPHAAKYIAKHGKRTQDVQGTVVGNAP